MATNRALVRQAFYDRLELDDTFYNFYDDLEDSEIQSIADERANTYIGEAITMLKRKCEPEIDFSLSSGDAPTTFADDWTDEEILLIGGDLAFEVYIGREVAKMKTRVNTFTSSDLKALHSPANERKSFMDMYKQIQLDNQAKIADYASRNRLTGKFLSVNEEGVGYDS